MNVLAPRAIRQSVAGSGMKPVSPAKFVGEFICSPDCPSDRKTLVGSWPGTKRNVSRPAEFSSPNLNVNISPPVEKKTVRDCVVGHYGTGK